ncbi:MAG: phosphate/phosphite/phosphonate ABC transporter substrate-binding protein [Xenococcaceae cyanobacterium]
MVSFGESDRSIEQYSALKEYLGAELNSIIELEPTYNELKALQQINRQDWDLVFAPPGLAAIAISQSQYLPIFPLEGLQKTRSVIVVLKESPITELPELAGKAIALGQPGSATGYYLPIYNLYGLTLSAVRFAPTPKTILEWIALQEVVAGALSLAEFNRYRSDFPYAQFRILDTDSHNVPRGAILVAPTVERNQQEQIRKALANVSPAIAADAGYIPNAPVPDYQYLIGVVARVTPIAERIKETPAPLYEKKTDSQRTPN